MGSCIVLCVGFECIYIFTSYNPLVIVFDGYYFIMYTEWLTFSVRTIIMWCETGIQYIIIYYENNNFIFLNYTFSKYQQLNGNF